MSLEATAQAVEALGSGGGAILPTPEGKELGKQRQAVERCFRVSRSAVAQSHYYARAPKSHPALLSIRDCVTVLCVLTISGVRLGFDSELTMKASHCGILGILSVTNALTIP